MGIDWRGVGPIFLGAALVQIVRRGLALATYEERQRCAGAITRRRSSALFAPAATAPGGVTWLHLQETWIAP